MSVLVLIHVLMSEYCFHISSQIILELVQEVGKFSTVTLICSKVTVICIQCAGCFVPCFICSSLPDDVIYHLSFYFQYSFLLFVFCLLQYNLLKDIVEKWKSIPEINKGKIIISRTQIHFYKQ